jgi:type I restriction enzyme S subunit
VGRFTFPLPPLPEQRRIVAKVDELMALCDRLEAAQKERESWRDRLVAASLHRLNQPADPAAFRDHARFHLHHLPRTTTRPEHIKKLRETILNLAVRGRLVPQEAKDEPAKELLKAIANERAELVGAGRIRREKKLTPVSIEDLPFEVPATWIWAKIGDAALFTEYGTSQQSAHSASGVPVIKMGDIQDGNVELGGQKKVPSTIEDLPGLYLRKLDLLYNRTNSPELVGKTGIYMGADDEYTFASYLIRIRCSAHSSSPVYFNLAMNAPYFRATQIVPHLRQQCGQANVNGTTLKNMVIPLPPLAEQHRIVAKVDELMAVCDRLEAQLTAAQTESRRLLEAVLYEALAQATDKPITA